MNYLKTTTLKEAVSLVKSGDRVFLQGAAMTPIPLIDALCDQHKNLQDVELFSIHTEGKARYTESPYKQAFTINSCFVGGNVRNAINTGLGTYIPIFLSEVH